MKCLNAKWIFEVKNLIKLQQKATSSLVECKTRWRAQNNQTKTRKRKKTKKTTRNLHQPKAFIHHPPSE